MGKAVEQIALRRGHEIVAKVDRNPDLEIPHELRSQIDVAIEFTQPDAALKNVLWCLNHDIKVVSGTTGWLADKPKADEVCRQRNGSLFHASNFSIGVNLFFKMNEMAARLMSRFPEYEVEIQEIHHTEKKDSPSGTALVLAEKLMAQIPSLKRWENTPSSQPEVLSIISERIPNVPGTHTVRYNSPIEDIELTHIAQSREGFATGAVLVAEWIRTQQGVLSMNDFLKLD